MMFLSAAPVFAGGVAPSGGAQVLEQSVLLQRGSTRDTAARVIDVLRPCVLLVIVDEDGFDVGLKTWSSARDPTLAVDVENGQQGESLEIAVLAVPKPMQLTITLDGPQERVTPGSPRLRVVSYPPPGRQTEAQRLRLDALQSWMRSTRADMTPELARRDAIPELERAITRFTSGPAEDASLAARARLLRARILYNLELGWKDAWTEARRATAAFLSPAVNDRLNAARSRWLEAAALQEISLDRTARDPTASQAGQESRAILDGILTTSAMDAIGRGRTFNLLALADRYALDWAKARERFGSAVAQYRAAGHRAGEIQSLQNLALLESDRGDYSSAVVEYETLLANVDSINDPELRAAILINAAAAESNAGQTDAAIAHYLRALAITQQHHFDPPQGRVLHGLGTAYWARGDFSQAETYFNEALAIRTRLQDGLGMFASLLSVGKLMRASGNANAALVHHQAALARAPNGLFELQALVQVAEDEAALGDRDAAIGTARKALAIKLATADHPSRADARLTLARLLMARDVSSDAERAEALSLAQDSIRAARSSTDIPTEIEARRVLARALAGAGRRAAASAELKRSIELIFAYRNSSASPELRASTLAGQQQVFRDLIDLDLPQDGAVGAWSAHALTAERNETLRVLESVRALNFDAQRSRVAAGLEPLDAALSGLASRQIRIAALRARETPPQRDIELLQLEMANLRAHIDQLRAGPASVNPTALADWLPPAQGEMQLSYLAGSRRLFVLMRTAAEARLWTAPRTPTALDAAVHALAKIDRTQQPQAYDMALIALSATLLPPTDAYANARSLRIAADGSLASVPFAGLSFRGDPSRRLVDGQLIRMTASLLGERASSSVKARKFRLATIGGSSTSGSDTLTPLPGAEREVRAIADILAASIKRDSRPAQTFDASNASASAIRATLESGVDVMHFATHGFIDARHPLAAMLALPGLGAGQRYLTSGEVQEWRGSAQLVFLSACETAVGAARFGESLPGLQRAFLRAGADEVVATLWPVEDRLAEDFAVQFYRRLAAGDDAATALAETQRAWAVPSSGMSAQKAQRMKVAAWAYALYSR